MFEMSEGNRRAKRARLKWEEATTSAVCMRQPLPSSIRMAYELDRWSARLARNLGVNHLHGVPSTYMDFTKVVDGSLRYDYSHPKLREGSFVIYHGHLIKVIP